MLINSINDKLYSRAIRVVYISDWFLGDVKRSFSTSKLPVDCLVLFQRASHRPGQYTCSLGKSALFHTQTHLFRVAVIYKITIIKLTSFFFLLFATKSIRIRYV